MDVAQITNHPDLQQVLQRVQQNCTKKNKVFSDIVDDAGHQYVDLVMEGGGMLGIALVGYTYVLEQAGIRFLGIGGTSAGSINALLLAALGTPAETKGDKLLAELASKNFFEFVDGDSDARDLIESWIEGAGNVKLAFKAAQVIDNLQNDYGLNPGEAFTKWIREILKREGIETLAQLEKRMHTLPKGLKKRSGELVDSKYIKLALIAADISTETKVEFPRMAKLYWKDPATVNPALFVRASMSIPYFFHPFQLRSLPQGVDAEKNWRELAGYDVAAEGFPKEALMVDGGVMSNFPIDVFHNHLKVPSAPTFGVKLELDKRRKKIDGPLKLFGAIFNAARHTLDYEFIRRNPDYRHLVTWIPAAGFNWLDFNMPDKQKIALFLEGAREAAAFLERFNWEDYKKIRAGTAAAATAGF